MPALSIVIPSNRTSLSAYGRIMSAGAWASDTIETVVRDNSCSAEKRNVLGLAEHPNFRVIFSELCDATTNFFEALGEARGDFVLFLGDDDAAFDRGIAGVADVAASQAGDPSIAGITGPYLFEDFDASRICGYENVDSANIQSRIAGFLSFDGPNLIFNSAVRRELVQRVWDYAMRHPFRFPFHDQLCSLLYLLSGRFVSVGRLVYVYQNTNWEVRSGAHPADLRWYATAEMDPAIRWLQWIICGFEGAGFIMHSPFGAQHSAEERQALANMWFATMFGRFVREPIVPTSSALHPAAAALADRWRSGSTNFSLDALLEEISGFIAMFSPEKA
ncbi:MAG TPA: hypothetical protein VKT30_05215, partial [Caulobacteraceae bacterium]|nr:hypothetical protein [Caulobacteraceae bacterium]